MRKKMREYLAEQLARSHGSGGGELNSTLDVLLSEELITPAQIEEIRKGKAKLGSPVIAPSPWMYWNVHLDGLERTHDLIVEREGVFKECIAAIRMS